MGKPDPLAAALDAARPKQTSSVCRVLVLFGDRPDVLESIKRARVDRLLSYDQIAGILSTPGASLSGSAIKTYLREIGAEK